MSQHTPSTAIIKKERHREKTNEYRIFKPVEITIRRGLR
jgi:hypothetical protein